MARVAQIPPTVDPEKAIVASDGRFDFDPVRVSPRTATATNISLKRAPNGIVLIPQPSDDPQDPLNWSKWKKVGILGVVVCNAFVSDYSVATGASALIPQAKEWHISTSTVNHAIAGMTFMLGVGGLAAVWLSAYIGRLPVLFWFSVLSAGTAAWAAAARSFESYMAARILQATFVVAAAAGALTWLNDVWFFHEHPRKINILATAIILSPYLGPQFMAAIISVSTWRSGLWLCFSIITFGLVCTILLGDEPFYPRHLSQEQVPPRKSHILRLVGIEQAQTNYTTNSFLSAGSRLAHTLMKLPVFLTCLYYCLDFPWTIGINTTISVFIVPEYHFSYRNLAAIYAAPVLGGVLALIFGHFAFDIIADICAKRCPKLLGPENRLIMLWIVLPAKLISHNLIGSTLQNHWSYWVLAVGWCMHTFTEVLTTSAVGAYLIDAYPQASGESGAWLNFARTVGGFTVGYVQIPWASSMGTQKQYGIQSAIMGAAFAIVVVLQWYGPGLRHFQKPLQFKTN